MSAAAPRGSAMRDAVVVIPARYASVRFPGKPLAPIDGKPMVQHVWERACQASKRVLVATEDERIAKVVRGFGGEVVMTRADHPNGTSRIAEVAATRHEGVVVNVQGDEPGIEPQNIVLAVEALRGAGRGVPMATVASPFAAGEKVDDPALVKVVLDRRGRALYFSRAPIPFDRDGASRGGPPAAAPLRHIGLYAYQRRFLATFVALEPTPLELTEQLEQLRALEHGYPIAVAIAPSSSHGIDTPEQLKTFESALRAGSEPGAPRRP